MKKTTIDKTNAERQRRYVARLKERAAEPHSPDAVLAALAKLKPVHFPKGSVEDFAMKVIAEAERLSISNTSPEITRPVSNGKRKAKREAKRSGRRQVR